MNSEESRRIAATLAHKLGEGSDAAQVADALVTTFQEIDVALNPVIGHRGVAALYARSLHLTGPGYPWLAGLTDGVETALDLAALKSGVAQQSSANAAAGGGALLQTFYELLASVVGPSLTERLLRSVWANFTSASLAQDIS